MNITMLTSSITVGYHQYHILCSWAIQVTQLLLTLLCSFETNSNFTEQTIK